MIVTALLFGLISSLHCIAMCGPIAAMLPVSQHNPEKKALQILVYHLGRITAYSLIGFLFGTLGRGLFMAGFQQWLSIIAGILIIVIAVVPEKEFSRFNFSKPAFRLISSVRAKMGSRLRNQTFQSIFTVGILNGLLPCAMVYAALFGALAMDSVAESSAFMAFFGIGTIPLMSIVVYANGWITVPLRNRLQKVLPYAVAILGVMFVLRGLSLDIPNISPSSLDLFVQSRPNCG